MRLWAAVLAVALLCQPAHTQAQAKANDGHCLAASAAGGCQSGPPTFANGFLKPGAHIAFTRPTDRYAHGVLGDAIEWGGLQFTLMGTGRDGPMFAYELVLPQDRVFEDLTPRLVDVDQDGRFEVIVVESQKDTGAQLAIYKLNDLNETFDKIAATPHIGTPNRWLAPIGAADLDGDGHIEIAYIDRPHLAKTLRIWRFKNGRLRNIGAMKGLTNHRIGDAEIPGGIRHCGQGPELITANANWTRVMATRFDGKTIRSRPIARFTNNQSLTAALGCR